MALIRKIKVNDGNKKLETSGIKYDTAEEEKLQK